MILQQETTFFLEAGKQRNSVSVELDVGRLLSLEMILLNTFAISVFYCFKEHSDRFFLSNRVVNDNSRSSSGCVKCGKQWINVTLIEFKRLVCCSDWDLNTLLLRRRLSGLSTCPARFNDSRYTWPVHFSRTLYGHLKRSLLWSGQQTAVSTLVPLRPRWSSEVSRTTQTALWVLCDGHVNISSWPSKPKYVKNYVICRFRRQDSCVFILSCAASRNLRVQDKCNKMTMCSSPAPAA